jgi:predicted nuclease of restriction endonuclease-like (RecB) superfamily
MSDITNKNLESVYTNIKNVLDEARNKAIRSVNFAMVQAYWHIGRLIVEEEQSGKERADYGKYLIRELSKKLSSDFGKGFDERNLWYMRSFYITFPNVNALRSELTWTHYRILLRIENNDARNFYLIESINSNWSTRELERQINSLLYERIALSSDKQKVKELSARGNQIQNSNDLIKDPYVLEFLGLEENRVYQEKDLEKALIDRLQDFMLELGKGFSFVGRQKRITVDGDHFYVDLVFYNYEIKCFVLIDLKVGKLTHQDIGQMDFYVRYFEKEIKPEGDNPTIGLILCTDKNDTMIKYTLLEDSKQIFASRYKLYLPSEEEFKAELEKERSFLELEEKLDKTEKNICSESPT